jgi:hypothetical protein
MRVGKQQQDDRLEQQEGLLTTIRGIVIGTGPVVEPKNTEGGRTACNPFIDYLAVDYLNRSDVHSALHANMTGIPYMWTPCSDTLTNGTEARHRRCR